MYAIIFFSISLSSILLQVVASKASGIERERERKVNTYKLAICTT
jgi:hypothetical protein